MTKTIKPRYFAKAEGDAGELYLYDAIGADSWGAGISPKAVVDSLEEIKKSGAQSLNIYLNSPGGSVFDGIAIYNAIKRFDGKRTVYVDGLAASIASVIAMAGDRIIMAENALFMVHNPQGVVIGEASDMRKQADILDQIKNVMIETYAARTGNNAQTLAEWLSDETWLDSKAAIKAGFADEILSNKLPDEDEDEEEEDDKEDFDDRASIFRALEKFKKAPKFAAKLLRRNMPSKPTEVKPMQDNQIEARFPEFNERVNKFESMERELLTITGKTNFSDALVAVAGLKERAAQADLLREQLAKVEAERKESDIKALLDEAVRDSRLTPAKRAEIDSQRGGSQGQAFMRDPASLKAFLDYLPKNISAPVQPPATANAEPIVTPEIAHIAAQLGLDPKMVAARAAPILRQQLNPQLNQFGRE